MSYDPKYVLNKFLDLKRLNTSINSMPSINQTVANLYPLESHGRNRNIFTPHSMMNKISDVSYNPDMANELMKDIRIRQEEFFKRIRKYPSKLDEV